VNLILLEAREVHADGPATSVTLDGVRARHLIDVLKVTMGQQVRVGILDGARGTAAVVSIANDGVTLRCQFEPDVPPPPRVDLLLALPRPKVMRRLWAQVAAMGVGRIILTNAERVERDYFDAHVLSPEVYRPLLVEGLQQARDTRVPIVSIHRRFRVLVEDELDALCPAGLRVVADPGAPSSVRALTASAGSEARVLLAIGPEGGWNAFERTLLESHGFHAIGMGPRTLRTDTACIALLALVHDALGGQPGV
jgi:RsmE family RNA methyltransferase